MGNREERETEKSNCERTHRAKIVPRHWNSVRDLVAIDPSSGSYPKLADTNSLSPIDFPF